MAQSNIPTDDLQPGSSLTIDFESGPVGLVSVGRAIAVIGAKTAGGTGVIGEPNQVFGGADSDASAGQGSFSALALKKIFEVFKLLGGAAEVFFVPVADPAGTAATFTFTAVGTATEGGDYVFKIAGRTLRAPITSGDTATTIAAAISTAIAGKVADLPGTAGSAIGVCTFTCAVTGVNGNDVTVETVSTPAGVVVTAAAAVTGAGTIDITTSLDALESKDYQSLVITNRLAADVTDLTAHLISMWSSNYGRYRHAFVGDRTSLGSATTLASGADRNSIVVLSYEGAGSLPGEIAAAAGAMRLTKEKPNYNWDGTVLPLFGPSDSVAYEDSEIKTALKAGVTPFQKTKQGASLVRLVTTQTTDSSGNPFDKGRDLANSATAGYVARQIDIAVARAIKGKDMDTELLRTVRAVILRILRLSEVATYLHNVEKHSDEIEVAPHPSVETRVLYDFPAPVLPNAHQADGTMRVILEGAEI